MYANYHTHTFRCRHAVGTEREYIENALASGMKILGFSDHTPFPDGRKSGMYPEELPDYVQTVRSLKEEYQDRLEIHCGLEVEYDPASFHRLLPLLRENSIEYMILGEHYLFGLPDEPPVVRPAIQDPAILDRLLGLMLEALGTGLFTYVAHPDLCQFTGSAQHYRKFAETLCRYSVDHQIPMEINLLGLRKQRHYPNPAFWEVAGEIGCPVILGLDAHDPDCFLDTKAPGLAKEMAEKFHLNMIKTVPLKPIG